MSRSFAERRLREKIKTLEHKYKLKVHAVNSAFQSLLREVQFIKHENLEEQIKELNSNQSWFLQQLEKKFNEEVENYVNANPNIKREVEAQANVNIEQVGEAANSNKEDDGKSRTGETTATKSKIIIGGKI